MRLSERLTQDFLSAIWTDLQSTNRMSTCMTYAVVPTLSVAATAFSHALENTLYVQPLDGDTPYYDPSAHLVVFSRCRLMEGEPWSPGEVKRKLKC